MLIAESNSYVVRMEPKDMHPFQEEYRTNVECTDRPYVELEGNELNDENSSYPIKIELLEIYEDEADCNSQEGTCGIVKETARSNMKQKEKVLSQQDVFKMEEMHSIQEGFGTIPEGTSRFSIELVQLIHEDSSYPIKIEPQEIVETETDCNLQETPCTVVQKKSQENSLRTHAGVKFTCNICFQKFAHKHSLNVHLKTHTSKGEIREDATHRLKADSPVRDDSRRIPIKIKRGKHYRKKRYPCKICSRTFSGKWRLATHLTTHTGDKPFACNICSRAYAEKYSLTRHMRMHTGETFSCDFCSRTYAEKYSLARHMGIHTGETFSCDICYRRFSQKSTLVSHLKTHLEPFSSVQKFGEKQSTNINLRTTGDKPFACYICPRVYSVKRSLTSHLRIHTEHTFVCDICSRKFTQKGQLISHLVTHTGEKPFACDICYRRFSQKSTLVYHLKTHSEPFACVICFQKFSKKFHLATHLRVHTGDKTLACTVSPQMLFEEGRLLDDTHTDWNLFACHICSRKFHHKSHLFSHFRSHTNDKRFQEEYSTHIEATSNMEPKEKVLTEDDSSYSIKIEPLEIIEDEGDCHLQEETGSIIESTARFTKELKENALKNENSLHTIKIEPLEIIECGADSYLQEEHGSIVEDTSRSSKEEEEFIGQN